MTPCHPFALRAVGLGFAGAGSKDYPIRHHIHAAILTRFDPALNQHLHPFAHVLGHHFSLFAENRDWEEHALLFAIAHADAEGRVNRIALFGRLAFGVFGGVADDN